MIKKAYDVIAIGGGSGGISFLKSCKKYNPNLKMALIDKNADTLGGTCVNQGCVPKKIMYSTALIAESLHNAHYYGFEGINDDIKFNWSIMKSKRDAHIKRLNSIYQNSLKGIDIYHNTATFINNKQLKLDDHNSTILTGEKILIATGTSNNSYLNQDYVINSDDFFNLTQQPKKMAIIGAGYIAVEIGQLMASLGTEVTLICRHNKPLRAVDNYITDYLVEYMKIHHQNFKLVTKTTVTKVIKNENQKTYKLETKTTSKYQQQQQQQQQVHDDDVKGEVEINSLDNFDQVLIATGRSPNTKHLGLENTDIQVDDKGYIKVNEFQETNVSHIYAVGDVIGKYTLTPVAIAASRKLARRLFNNEHDSKLIYENIPTVIFSHPPIGTVGLSERQAVDKYGQDHVYYYRSKFRNLFYSPLYSPLQDDRPYTLMKVIVVKYPDNDDEQVVGIHMIGLNCDEILQGFGVAINLNITKKQLDQCVAIHPTAAEELVTMKTRYPSKL